MSNDCRVTLSLHSSFSDVGRPVQLLPNGINIDKSRSTRVHIVRYEIPYKNNRAFIMAQSVKSDPWSSKAYTSAAGFVPKLTTTVLSYLSPNPTDHILDIGCGDGILTAQINSLVPEGFVLGLDASASMIATAKSTYSSTGLSFDVHDCRQLCSNPAVKSKKGGWDKVFSNAALHWILRDPDTRMNVLRDVHAALKPGGSFVFEQGGAGNVAEVHVTLIGALVAHGVPLAEAQEASLWFFPSEA